MKVEAVFQQSYGFESGISGLVDLHHRPLLHKLSKLSLVFCPAEIELYLKYTSVLQVYFWRYVDFKVCETGK